MTKIIDSYSDLVKRLLSRRSKHIPHQHAMDIVSIWITAFCQRSESFPVDLEDIAKWLNMRKSVAKRAIGRLHLELGKDYIIRTPETKKGGRPHEEVLLSVESCKRILLQSRTRLGERIREYFLFVENLLLEITIDSEINWNSSTIQETIHQCERDLDRIEKRPELRLKDEAFYQSLLESRHCGKHVNNPYGVTDVTTAQQHIEVKAWPEYKAALGQILFYQEGDHRKILSVYLFGECSYDEQKVQEIACVFEKFGIGLYEFVGENDDIRNITIHNSSTFCQS